MNYDLHLLEVFLFRKEKEVWIKKEENMVMDISEQFHQELSNIDLDIRMKRVEESTTQVNSVFKTICKKAEVKCYGQHSLRHTFATRCIEAGVPALVLKGWLGHKDIHVTLDTYVDVFSRMEFGEMTKLDSYLEDLIGDK